MNPTHIPIRVATGAYILNSGIGKLGADEGTAQFLHGAAAGTYPSVFKDMKPKTFAQVLAYSEIAVGRRAAPAQGRARPSPAPR